jgi:hypothetical protein
MPCSKQRLCSRLDPAIESRFCGVFDIDVASDHGGRMLRAGVASQNAGQRRPTAFASYVDDPYFHTWTSLRTSVVSTSLVKITRYGMRSTVGLSNEKTIALAQKVLGPAVRHVPLDAACNGVWACESRTSIPVCRESDLPSVLMPRRRTAAQRYVAIMCFKVPVCRGRPPRTVRCICTVFEYGSIDNEWWEETEEEFL